jgi:hypothetical protein
MHPHLPKAETTAISLLARELSQCESKQKDRRSVSAETRTPVLSKILEWNRSEAATVQCSRPFGQVVDEFPRIPGVMV